MQTRIVTSVSLPQSAASCWRKNRREIMAFAERFLRLRMRGEMRRSVARTYNRATEAFAIVTTRFTAAEYDTLHYVAASLRVSVSSLIHGIIQLWLKPSRRAIRRFIASNYDYTIVKWDPEAGFIEENLHFWQYEPKHLTPLAENPPPP